MAVVETVNLTRVYGNHTAVDNLCLSVDEGEVFGFLGPNGSGKTTTLHMLLGLTAPTSGTARVLGRDPVHQAVAIKREVGFLPEHLGFYGDMTARQNLDFVAALNGLNAVQAQGRIEAALAAVGLGSADGRVATFSRGMRQRLGIAEVLVKQARLLFADEPTLGLDPEGADTIMDFIGRLVKDQGLTVILSSHDLAQVQKLCHRVGLMHKGRLVAEGPVNTLLEGITEEAPTLDALYRRVFQQEAP